jgi:hypothetical protein
LTHTRRRYPWVSYIPLRASITHPWAVNGNFKYDLNSKYLLD